MAFSAIKNMIKPKATPSATRSATLPAALSPATPSATPSSRPSARPSATPSATPYANMLEQFLELAETCNEQAQKMTMPSADSSSPKVNFELCKHLADKLKLAVESAHLFLLNIGFLSPEDVAEYLDIFKLLYAFANVAEDVIQSCCQDAWVQAAFLMTNASEHILSISFDFEMLTHFFSGGLTSTNLVDSVFKAEAAIVRTKASHDRETLLRDVNAFLQTKEKTSSEYQLAYLLRKRIETRRENLAGSLFGAHCTDLKSLEVLQQVGKGSFGTVYKAMWLGVEVAKKTFYAPTSPDFEKEVSILARLYHPNITSLLCYAQGKRECCMVMELMDGDLFHLMRKIMAEDNTLSYPFSIWEVVDIILQVGRGMEYLHEMKIVHRGLKTMNILVQHVKGRECEGNRKYILAKLNDFGLSKTKERSMTCSYQTPNTGTTRWMAPEVIKSSGNKEQVSDDSMIVKYPFRGDVYSFAMVCYEILSGNIPYSEVTSLNEVKKKVLRGERPGVPSYCPRKLKHLIERCWSQNPSERPRFSEICGELRHLKCQLLMSCYNMVDKGKEPAGKWKQTASTSGPHSREVYDMPCVIPDKYVIGLDFGNTYSGFAYARVDDCPNINLYYDWPRTGNERPYCKTLTALHYKWTEDGHLECASWGYSARSEYMNHRYGSQHDGPGLYFTNFKVLLEKDLNDSDMARIIPAPFTATRIIINYLKHIGELALSVVRDIMGGVVFSMDSVQWCVTVPSTWNENAKQQFKACMVNAGLVSAEARGIEAVKVVLESEAASFYFLQASEPASFYFLQAVKGLRWRKDPSSLIAKDKILVAVVGDSMVDIVVQEVIGNSQIYQVKKLTERSSRPCGAAFVDESFIRFLSKKIGCLDEFLRNDVPTFKTRLLRDWEDIKLIFGHECMSDTDTMEINLHPKLARKWEAYELERGNAREDFSVVEVTEEDLISIFDPVVDEILEFIDSQLTQVPDVKMMCLVGEFAGSPYLTKRIHAQFGTKVSCIASPPNPSGAIAQGAVSLTLDSIISNKTYGTSAILPFDPKLDPSELLNVTNGVEYCRNRFDVFVKKGRPLSVNTCVTKTYQPHSHGQRRISFDLYSSTDQHPRYTEGITVSYEGGFAITLPEYDSTDRPEVHLTMYFGRSGIELRVNAQFKDGSGKIAKTLELPVAYHY